MMAIHRTLPAASLLAAVFATFASPTLATQATVAGEHEPETLPVVLGIHEACDLLDEQRGDASAWVSVLVGADGTASHVSISRSSRDRTIDRIVQREVRTMLFDVSQESVRPSPTGDRRLFSTKLHSPSGWSQEQCVDYVVEAINEPGAERMLGRIELKRLPAGVGQVELWMTGEAGTAPARVHVFTEGDIGRTFDLAFKYSGPRLSRLEFRNDGALISTASALVDMSWQRFSFVGKTGQR